MPTPTPSAPNSLPSQTSRTTNEWIASLQKFLNQFNNKNYKGTKPIGNPVPFSQLMKSLAPDPKPRPKIS